MECAEAVEDDEVSSCSAGGRMNKAKKIPKGTFQDTSWNIALHDVFQCRFQKCDPHSFQSLHGVIRHTDKTIQSILDHLDTLGCLPPGWKDSTISSRWGQSQNPLLMKKQFGELERNLGFNYVPKWSSCASSLDLRTQIRRPTRKPQPCEPWKCKAFFNKPPCGISGISGKIVAT